MKKAAVSAIIAIAIIGIILGALLIVFAQPSIIDTVINITLIIVGIVTIVSNIPGLIGGIVSASTRQGLLDIIWSALGIILGTILIFRHSMIVSVIVAVYLIVMPIVRIIIADKKTAQLKKELGKLTVGLIIAVLAPITSGGTTAIICWLLRIAGGLLILLSIVFAAVEIILVSRKREFREPSKIYADTNGDGSIDTIYADTTGDGKIDTEIKLNRDEEE